MRLRFEGGREMAQMLRSLPGIVAEQLLEKALGSAAGVLLRVARTKVPRPAERRRPRTKRLADSLRAFPVEKNRSRVVIHVGTRTPYAHLVERGHEIVARGKGRAGLEKLSRQDKRQARLLAMPGPRSPELEAALRARTQGRAQRFQVLRSALHQRRAAGALGMVTPRPFLEPAFLETREAMVQRMGQELGQGIERAAAQLGRRG